MKATKSTISRLRQKSSSQKNQITFNQYIEKLIKLFPLFTAYVILLGIWRLTIYYNNFNINVIDFLNFSEILTSFLDKAILVISTIILVLTLFGLIFLLFEDSIYKVNVTKGYKPILIILISLILLFADLIYHTLEPSQDKVSLWRVIAKIIVNFLVFAIFSFFYIKGLIKKKQKNQQLYFHIFVLLFTVIGFFSFNSLAKYNSYLNYDIKRNKKYMNVSFILDDRLIQGDSTHYYIGKTNNYLFFYDEEKDKTTVYPMNRIKEISF